MLVLVFILVLLLLEPSSRKTLRGEDSVDKSVFEQKLSVMGQPESCQDPWGEEEEEV